MHITKIDNQIFYARKLRIPIKEIITPYGNIKCKGEFIQEYENPQAEELLKQADQIHITSIESMQKKAKILEQMGDYRIINTKAEKIIKRFIKSQLS